MSAITAKSLSTTSLKKQDITEEKLAIRFKLKRADIRNMWENAQTGSWSLSRRYQPV